MVKLVHKCCTVKLFAIFFKNLKRVFASIEFKRNYPVLLFKTIFRHLGTSHNLSWRGRGVEEKLGAFNFFGWNKGGLKMPKDDPGGYSSFFYVASLLSSMMLEY